MSGAVRQSVTLLLTGMLLGCAHVVAVDRVDELAGEWTGRRFGPIGNAAAALTIASGGAYTGTAYLDAGDHAFHGSLIVVRRGEIRYQGSDGAGAVRVLDEAGRTVLKFLRDDGGVEAVFDRRPPPP